MSDDERLLETPDEERNPTLEVARRLLEEIHELYSPKGRNGLLRIARAAGVTSITAPRKKILVMFIGNHSVGKSSIINWYIQEEIQRTSVAVETQGFCILTHGLARQTLKGPATLEIYPQFRGVADSVKGVFEYLSTEISTSKHRQFPLVTLLDTPGLVDGNMVYPFDPQAAIAAFAREADMVCALFDPIGQGLCRRTMEIIEEIDGQDPQKLRFYLSKADTVPHETDRMKVLIQVTQNLVSRIRNKTFDLWPIYLPTAENAGVPVLNHINYLCNDIEACVNRRVQRTMMNFKADAETLARRLAKLLARDAAQRASNSRFRLQFLGIMVALAAVLAVFGLHFAHETQRWKDLDFAHKEHIDWGVRLVGRHLPKMDVYATAQAVVGVLCTLLVARILLRFVKPTLSRAQRQQYTEWLAYLEGDVGRESSRMYDAFFATILKEEVDRH